MNETPYDTEERAAAAAQQASSKTKRSFGQWLRSLTRLRIMRKPEPQEAVTAQEAAESDLSGMDNSQAGGLDAAAGAVDREETEKKPGKAKKPKAPKKPRAKKTKQPKAAAHKGKKSQSGGYKKPVLIVCLVLAVVALGSGVLAMTIMRPSSPEAMLEKAVLLTGQGKYEQAVKMYNQVIDQGELVAEAYLGMADTLEDAQEPEAALPKLELGYEATGDSRLLDRYQDIAGTLPDSMKDEGLSIPLNLPIQWQDPAFEAMVRQALNIPAGEEIYQNDLSSVTTLRILGGTHAAATRGGDASGISNRNDVDSYEVDGVIYSQRGDITSLVDVAHFQNLTRLTVAYNRVESIDGVQHLPRLRMLALYANEISDLSPLEGMETLQWLYLFNNHISDITPLASLTGLEGLSLQHNNISDLSPLAGLSGLEELFMSNNHITNITPLASLQDLKFLYLQNNQVSDISVVAQLPALTDVNFVDNPVSDYSPAAHAFNVNRSFASFS